MKELNIYYPNKSFTVKFLPKILEQVSSKGHKSLVLCNDLSQMAKIDEYLWSYEQLSFLPHVTENDEEIAQSPIVLCTKMLNNDADVLVIPGEVPGDLNQFSSRFNKIICICNDNQQAIPDDKIEGFKVSRFKQNDSGAWSKMGQS